MGFSGSSDGKKSACNAGDLSSIPGLGRPPGGGPGNPLQYSCLENPHGQRSLEGYSPWGCKGSDTTEHAGLEEAQAGIKIAGRNINHLRYADDTTLMASLQSLDIYINTS